MTGLTGHPLFVAGLAEFRHGHFFEAHEEWEALWKERRGDEKVCLQALIQMAAGCVHAGRGNRAPALRLFALAKEKLSRLPPDFDGVPAAALRTALTEAGEQFPDRADWPDLASFFGF